MNRCDPVEMRKNLQIVNEFKLASMDFVAIPVRNEEEKQEYLAIMNEQLESILEEV